MAILPFSRAPKPRNCRFVFGENHPPQMRAIYCIGAGPGLIFLNDASNRAWKPCAGMMETTVPKGSLAAMRSSAGVPSPRS